MNALFALGLSCVVAAGTGQAPSPTSKEKEDTLAQRLVQHDWKFAIQNDARFASPLLASGYLVLSLQAGSSPEKGTAWLWRLDTSADKKGLRANNVYRGKYELGSPARNGEFVELKLGFTKRLFCLPTSNVDRYPETAWDSVGLILRLGLEDGKLPAKQFTAEHTRAFLTNARGDEDSEREAKPPQTGLPITKAQALEVYSHLLGIPSGSAPDMKRVLLRDELAGQLILDRPPEGYRFKTAK